MDLIIIKASEIFADTNKGLTSSQLIKRFVDYAIKFRKDITHKDIKSNSSSFFVAKKTLFTENIKCFSNEEIFYIIDDFCNDDKFNDKEDVIQLKHLLYSSYKKYNKLQVENENLDFNAIEETKHWLNEYPEVKKVYEEGINKYNLKTYERNVLDDMRLSLELLWKKILSRECSLENQKVEIGKWLKKKDTTPHFRNMFSSLTKYFTDYQNDNIKHNDNVNIEEIEFIIELTSLFMRSIIKLNSN